MKILYSNRAYKSLKKSLSLLDSKVSPAKIEKIIEDLITDCEKLSRFPNLGKIDPILVHLELKHRSMLSGNYKIVYRIRGNEIIITDFFHTHRDPKKMNT